MLSSIIRRCLSTLIATAAAGCAAAPPPPPPVLTKCAPSSTNDQALQGEPPAQVTFYADVLPILSSNATGAAYKCTTCHAHYAEPSGLASVHEVDRIVAALESGRMPRGGDPVPAARIQTIRTWQLQGFQTGKMTDQPSAPLEGYPAAAASDSKKC